jgi:hypothetical protein
MSTKERKSWSIEVGEHRIESWDRQLWIEAGFEPKDDGRVEAKTSYAYRRLARAIGEGVKSGAVLFRAICIGEEESRLGRDRERLRLEVEVEQTRARAASIELEVEKLREKRLSLSTT